MPIHECIRSLYSAAVDVPPASFPNFAMRRAAAAIPCAAVLWHVADGTGAISVRRSAMLDARMDALTLVRVSLAEPSPASAGVALAACCVRPPGVQVDHHVGFVRAQPAQFDDPETEDLRMLALHMVAAEQLCREIALRVERPALRPDVSGGTAFADSAGNVLSADAHFFELLRGVVPGWDGGQLPFGLDAAIPSIAFRRLIVLVERHGEGFRLQLRRDRRESTLTDREFEIAQRVGVGLTFKEIARELGLAPSTVSTHLYNLYAKLGIRRRAELVAWLARRA